MSTATYTIQSDDKGRTLAIEGDWSSLTIGDEALGLGNALAGATGTTRLDLSRVGRIDTAGAYVILRATLPTLSPSPLPRETESLFALVRPAVEEEVEPGEVDPWLVRFFAHIGRALASLGNEIWRAAEYVGRLIVEIGHTLRSPRKLRIVSLAHVMEVAGIDALPIVMVMNFFIGAVVALVGASLLTSLGVAVFTIQLVGVAVLREFAVLFTGILLAGRSASSFAAQIGSMKMTQEIDAMQVIGVDPVQALVIPRVFALMLMMPVLIFAAMVAGIAGGLLVCWGMLGMSPVFFLERMHETVAVRHFWVGMSKAPLLAFLIAMAGCRHGLFVGGDVESLGARVTAAVVQAIFMIILFDAIFAIIYMQLKI